MLVRAKKMVALSVMALVATAISLPVASIAATSPAVSVLSPLAQGLRAPVKIALGADGNAYVADQRVGGVVKFNAYGVQLMTIRTAAAPAGLAFAQDGTLLVSQGAFVARYNVVSGLEVGRLAGGQLQAPVGVAVDDVTGYIYVADSAANQIEVYTASGSYVKAFAQGVRSDASGTTVSNPDGKLSMPTGISFEKVSRQLAVADTLSHRVQFFDVDGNFVKSIGIPLSTANYASVGPMQFDAPVAIAFEYSKSQVPVLNRMYVVDAFQGRVQVVDPATASALMVAGATNNYIGSSGTANGELMVPSDAVFDAINSRLLVVNGFGNVTVYGIDGGKNPFYVDLTPPTFTVNKIPAEVTVNTLTISGTVEAGSAVQIVAGGSVKVGPTVYSGLAWSAEVTALVAGNNSFTVAAKDVAGNTAVPQTVSVNYVLPAPAVTISPVSAVTKTAAITITGTVSDSGATVVVTNKATNISVNSVVSGTSWSCDVVLYEGLNYLILVAQKPNSATAVTSASVTLDTVAPALNVSMLTDNSNASDPVQNISGTVSDLNGVTVNVNGAIAALVGNAFSVPVTLLNGSNLVSVVAQDAAGNITVFNRTLNYTAGSVITVLGPVDNMITSNATLKISGSVDRTSTVTVSGITATVDANNWSATVDLLAGVNTIEIVATDLYGNSSSVKRSVTLDTVKPNLAVVAPVQDVAVNIPNVLIEGTVSDSTLLALEYSVNGSPAVTVPVASGMYSFNVDFAAEGNYRVALTAKDSAGNSSTVIRNVIYDITPPVFSLNQVNGVMPEKLDGTVEAGSSVVVKDGTSQIGSVLIANGSWSADLTGITYNADNLLVVATDAAGNSTSKTLAYNFPDGTLNTSGKPTVQDALRSIRIVVNQITPSAQELAHYDIGPLVNGKPNPNGKIEIVDAILILRKALGLKSW